jgi:fatty acid desaturase
MTGWPYFLLGGLFRISFLFHDTTAALSFQLTWFLFCLASRVFRVVYRPLFNFLCGRDGYHCS